MNTLFSPYSATPAGRRRRQHIREQVRHARTRRRSSTLSRVLDGARRKAGRRRAGRWRAARRRRERRSDATKSLFTQSFQAPHPLSLANWKKSQLELIQTGCLFTKCSYPKIMKYWNSWSETRLYYTLDVIVSSKQIKFSVFSHLWEGLVEKSRCDVFLMNLPIHAW